MVLFAVGAEGSSVAEFGLGERKIRESCEIFALLKLTAILKIT